MTDTFSIDNLSCLMDLHIHLDGAVSMASAKDLAALQNISIPGSDEELKKLMMVEPDCKDLNQFLEKFAFPCSLIQTKEGMKRCVENLLTELKAGGVMYTEIRFAPQLSTDKGLTQDEVVAAAIEGAKSVDGIISQFILCCMRGNGNHSANIETIDVAAKYLGKGVCAVDLAGAEAIFPNADYEDLFVYAREKNIPYTIHAGEADGPKSVEKALEFGTKRVGHGVRAIEDEKLAKRIADEKITLELCPTSNIQTVIYKDISEYPIRKWMQLGALVTINTDDPAIEGTNIKNEYKILQKQFDLSMDEIRQFLENSVNAAFADDKTKENLRHQISKEFDA